MLGTVRAARASSPSSPRGASRLRTAVRAETAITQATPTGTSTGRERHGLRPAARGGDAEGRGARKMGCGTMGDEGKERGDAAAVHLLLAATAVYAMRLPKGKELVRPGEIAADPAKNHVGFLASGY
jgi:hypothetical protein